MESAFGESYCQKKGKIKNMRMQVENNIIDLVSDDLPWNIPPILTVIRNPFGYDSNEHIPRSGPTVIDKSIVFNTDVEEAQKAINVAHVEVESVENGVGIVKLMGFIVLFATLASRDVDRCLIPESPFYLEGQNGLFEFIQQRFKENEHVVIVFAEGVDQEYVSENVNANEEKDASGNKLLLDIGQWLT
ncbi:hypothetical protein L1887_17949 [Cichorium endivia]|nr:hypothetical protein L1887_17949 [Cichorium endivia]